MLDRRLGAGAAGYDRRHVPARADHGRTAWRAGRRRRSKHSVPGKRPGRSYGGTLAQLVASLGTPFAFAPPKGHVLFLEDVAERPYSARSDADAAAARRDSGSRGGDRPGRVCRAATSRRARPLARAVLAGLLKDFNGPVVYGFPSGHTAGPVDDAAVRRAGARVVADGHAAVDHRRGGSRVKIHFIGVCGTAMATLAALLKRKGHDVQGSDENVYPPMSTFLESEQIRTFVGLQRRAHHTATSIWSSSATRFRAATSNWKRCWTGRCGTARCRRPCATTFCGHPARS